MSAPPPIGTDARRFAPAPTRTSRLSSPRVQDSSTITGTGGTPKDSGDTSLAEPQPETRTTVGVSLTARLSRPPTATADPTQSFAATAFRRPECVFDNGELD